MAVPEGDPVAEHREGDRLGRGSGVAEEACRPGDDAVDGLAREADHRVGGGP